MPAGILRTSKLFPGVTFCRQRNTAGRIVVPQITAARTGSSKWFGSKPLDERTSAKSKANIPIAKYGLAELGSFIGRLLGFMHSPEYHSGFTTFYRNPRRDA